MPRQVSVREVVVQKSRPYGTVGGIRKKIGCAGCKRSSGPTQKNQDVLRLSRSMSQMRLMAEINKSTPTDRHAQNILAAMGIGIVENIEIDSNPRSEVSTKIKLRADFSMFQIETDKTQIPNVKIVDKKSMLLKKGGIKFVKASDIIKTSIDANDPFFKPDDQMNSNSAAASRKISDSRKYTWASTILYSLQENQKKLPTKLMSPHFSVATRKYGFPERRQSFDATIL